MSDDLPENYDVIVIGTGLTESIVAAACARGGKQVLHLDHQDFYGGSWATFTLEALLKHVGLRNQSSEDEETNLPDLPENETFFPLVTEPGTLTNTTDEWFTNETSDEENAEQTTWTKSKILQSSRKFNLDLAPKILYARGDMVELLIQSGICRYAEFKLVSKLLTWFEETQRFVSVPCSRSDVFSSTEVSLVEKRLLMKVLTSCNEYEKLPEEFQAFENKTFSEFLESRQITGKIRQFVLDSVAMATESTAFPQAVANVQKFIKSLGRYGNSPFLWTLYGSGELPQCFCRLCAVFGGIYCLKRPTQGLLYNQETKKVMGIVSGNKILRAPFVVAGLSNFPQSKETAGTSRAIFVTDRSITDNDGDKISMICLPKMMIDGVDYSGIKMLELPHSAMACPKDLYVVHLTGNQASAAERDLRKIGEKFFSFTDSESDRPKVLWSFFFNISGHEAPTDLPEGVYPCAGPDSGVDLDHYVVKAREIFCKMFPDEEFLPRVPDPEDVIIEGIEDNPSSSASDSMAQSID